MKTFKGYLQEKGICWTGYKRKKGTKPYEDGSCVKEESDLEEGTFKYHMDKAIDAHDRGDVKKKDYHLDNARTAKFAMKTADYSKNKELLDKHKQMTEDLDETHKSEVEQHHVLAFGRMNPITSGHEAVVNKLHSVAKEHGASHSLVVSHSQDAKKNPLTGEQKVKHAKRAFPGTNVSSASKESPTILHHAAAAHASGATHLHVVAGSDRHEEMHNLLHKYNGKDSAHGHYNFKKITVHSSGERDPDADGTTGISASKMRDHAASGNKKDFHSGAPSKMTPKHKDEMMSDVRKGMGHKD